MKSMTLYLQKHDISSNKDNFSQGMILLLISMIYIQLYLLFSLLHYLLPLISIILYIKIWYDMIQPSAILKDPNGKPMSDNLIQY